MRLCVQMSHKELRPRTPLGFVLSNITVSFLLDISNRYGVMCDVITREIRRRFEIMDVAREIQDEVFTRSCGWLTVHMRTFEAVLCLYCR